jgi:lysophospholipid acyltransferase (LPLAT)-like uncharacterized protein
MLKRFSRAASVRAALAWLIGSYLSFALATTRWTVHGWEHLGPYVDVGHPVIVAFWHERLPLMPALFVRARRRRPGLRAAVLASRHSDGRLIGEMMRRFGTTVIHGSTARGGDDRGGATALRQMLAYRKGGGYIVLTPAGPRGPRRVAAMGMAQLAALSGEPVVPAAGQTSRRRVLDTWDRMVLPLPWGRGVLVCGPAIRVARGGVEAGLEAITTALTAAADRADQLCAS